MGSRSANSGIRGRSECRSSAGVVARSATGDSDSSAKDSGAKGRSGGNELFLVGKGLGKLTAKRCECLGCRTILTVAAFLSLVWPRSGNSRSAGLFWLGGGDDFPPIVVPGKPDPCRTILCRRSGRQSARTSRFTCFSALIRRASLMREASAEFTSPGEATPTKRRKSRAHLAHAMGKLLMA